MASFFRDDDGQGLVEYALIIAVIAIAVIVAMIFLRDQTLEHLQQYRQQPHVSGTPERPSIDCRA